MWQAVPYLLVELSFKSLSKIKKYYENIVYAPFSYNTLGCCLYLKNLTHYFTVCAQRPGLWWIEATLEKSCCFVVVFCFHRNDHFHGLAGIKITQFAHKKTGQVSSIARSPSASLLSKGQGTEHITVKWPIPETPNCLNEVQIRGLSIETPATLAGYCKYTEIGLIEIAGDTFSGKEKSRKPSRPVWSNRCEEFVFINKTAFPIPAVTF